MGSRATLERLAAAAHAVWCEQMQDNGWWRGEAYAESEMVHDALAPFEKLGELDRRDAVDAAERLVQQVMLEFSYPRGADREFTARDIAEGQRVRLCDAGRIAGAGEGPYYGRVVAWEQVPNSVLLKSITVRWDSGDVVEHVPSLRDLIRI